MLCLLDIAVNYIGSYECGKAEERLHSENVIILRSYIGCMSSIYRPQPVQAVDAIVRYPLLSIT